MPEPVVANGERGSSGQTSAEEAAAKAAAASDANVQDENRKLKEKLAEQSEQLIAMKEERLTLLEAKNKPTQQESAEIVTLQQQIDVIKSNPQAKAWLELIRMEARQLAKEEISGTSFEEHRLEAMEWVESKEKELGLKDGTLQTELLSVLEGGRWGDQDPRRRVRLAFLKWNEVAELKKKAEGSTTVSAPHSENGGRGSPPPVGFKDQIKESKETGKWGKTLNTLAEEQKTWQK